MTTKTNKELNARLKSLRSQSSKLFAEERRIEATLKRRAVENEKARKAALGYEMVSVNRLRVGMKIKTCGEFVKVTTLARARNGYRTLVLANGKVKNVWSYGTVMVAL